MKKSHDYSWLLNHNPIKKRELLNCDKLSSGYLSLINSTNPCPVTSCPTCPLTV